MVFLRTRTISELILNKCFTNKRNTFVDLTTLFILSSEEPKHKTAILKITLAM